MQMPAEEPVGLECWELEPLKLPERSRLYHLAPIGLGTYEVESLTGYVSRLAQAHSVLPLTLVRQEIMPYWSKISRPQSLAALWEKQALALNGTRKSAEEWVRILEKLTLRQDLGFLTMLPWSSVLSNYGLLRHERAWCPTCYQQWQAKGQVIYEPLLWALEVVEVCPHHQQPLIKQCPNLTCQRQLPLLASQIQPGYCSRCLSWLGTSSPIFLNGSESTAKSTDRTWEEWSARVMGELLALAPTMSAPLSKENLVKSLEGYLQQTGRSGVNRLEQQLGLTPATFWRWRKGQGAVELILLLRLCYYLNTTPRQFLTGQVESLKPDEKVEGSFCTTNLGRRLRGANRIFERSAIQAELEASLTDQTIPPPSMNQLAQRLGYRLSYLYEHFPELCRALSRRYQAYRKAGRQAKVQQFFEEVRGAMLKLYAQGQYPGIVPIAKQLGKPQAFILNPGARAAYRQTLEELGLEPGRRINRFRPPS